MTLGLILDRFQVNFHVRREIMFVLGSFQADGTLKLRLDSTFVTQMSFH